MPLANTGSGVGGEDEPLAFTLNTASFSDNFSIIENDTQELNDKNYNWDFITNDSNISDGIKNISGDASDTTMTKSEKTTNSLEELKKLRDSQKF
jgi:hypothetical protein